MLRREVLSNVHISIFPFPESCFGPGLTGPDLARSRLGPVAAAPPAPMPQTISSWPRNPRETPPESPDPGCSSSDKGRQKAFRGGCRPMSRGYPQQLFRAVHGRASSRLQRTQAAGKYLHTQIQANSIFTEGVSSNKNVNPMPTGLSFRSRYDEQRARPQRSRSPAPFCRRSLEKPAFATAPFGSTNPCPLQLQRQLPRTGWRTPRASRTALGL